MVRDGIYYGIGFTSAGTVLSLVFSPYWGLPCFVLGAFCMYFFRDPERQIPTGPLAVSPADGKVVHIRPLDNGGHRVSVFLNIFDVHVNRIPVGGVITAGGYRRGKFKMAHLEDASAENEQNSLTIDSDGSAVTVIQIAGLIARRIVCDKKIGDAVEKGQRYGLIKFGSRMDVFLGPEWELSVQRGDRVKGGSSVLARRAEMMAAVQRGDTARDSGSVSSAFGK